MVHRAIRADAAKIVSFLSEGISVQEGTVIVYNGGEEPQVFTSGDDPSNRSPSQQVNIGGKKWRFNVQRNEHGQITGLDVEQL